MRRLQPRILLVVTLFAAPLLSQGCGTKAAEKKSEAKSSDCDNATTTTDASSLDLAATTTTKPEATTKAASGSKETTTTTDPCASEESDTTVKTSKVATTTVPGKATASATTGDETDDGPVDDDSGAGDGGVPLGKVEGETTDSTLTGKAAWATLNEVSGTKSMTFIVTHAEATESQFKKIKDWGTCKKCEGTDDKHCKAGDASGMLTLTFTTLPLKEMYEKKGPTDFAMIIGFGTETATTGKLTFKKKPAAAGDEWAADVDFKLGAKGYKASLSGKVYTNPTQPKAPACDFKKEYLDPTYE